MNSNLLRVSFLKSILTWTMLLIAIGSDVLAGGDYLSLHRCTHIRASSERAAGTYLCVLNPTPAQATPGCLCNSSAIGIQRHDTPTHDSANKLVLEPRRQAVGCHSGREQSGQQAVALIIHDLQAKQDCRIGHRPQQVDFLFTSEERLIGWLQLGQFSSGLGWRWHTANEVSEHGKRESRHGAAVNHSRAGADRRQIRIAFAVVGSLDAQQDEMTSLNLSGEFCRIGA